MELRTWQESARAAESAPQVAESGHESGNTKRSGVSSNSHSAGAATFTRYLPTGFQAGSSEPIASKTPLRSSGFCVLRTRENGRSPQRCNKPNRAAQWPKRRRG